MAGEIDARRVHDFDQRGAWLEDIAPVLWSYFVNLKNAGFSRDEALTLVVAAQEEMLVK